MSSSAFPQPSAAWLPEPREPGDELPRLAVGTALPDPGPEPASDQPELPAPVVGTPAEVVPTAVVSELPLLPFAQVPEIYVGWGTRLCALAIDLVALVLPFAAGVMIDSALMAYDVPMLQGQLTVVPLVLAAIVWNRGVWQGRTGQSLGKRAMGIRLVRDATRQPVGVAVALVRELAHVVDTVSLVGWLNPLWSIRRQTFADQIVGGVVVG